MRFEIDWASLIVGSKFTVFAFFSLYLRAPWGLIFGGAIKRRFFALGVWGAYIWRGLYLEGLIFGILRFLFVTPKIIKLIYHKGFNILDAHSLP